MWLFFIITAFFMSCSNSLGDMVEDYNGAFSTETEEGESTEEKTVDFAEENMLYEKYFLASDETLNLSAPSGCTTYSWELTDPNDSSKGSNFASLFSASDVGYDKRRFVLYVPTNVTDGNLEVGKTYKLVLTVTLNGSEYTDTCAIVIYEALQV